MSYLLDTNVLSEARRPRGSPEVKAWLGTVPAGELYLSVLVLGEIRRGVELLRRKDAVQAEVYETWLGTVTRDYGDRILPVDPAVAEEWGRVSAGNPPPVVDRLMAATAKVRDMTFVTRNVGDVERTGVRVLNPFEPDG